MPAEVSHPQAGDALWLVPVLAIAKGLQMFAKLLPIFRQVLGLLMFLVVLAEHALGPGTGAQKKADVMANFKAGFYELAGAMSIPPWVVAIFTDDKILGFVIDVVVGLFNKLEDWPPAPAPALAAPPAQ